VAPCFYGIDMSTLAELYATRFIPRAYRGTMPEQACARMARELGADSLRYLSVEYLQPWSALYMAPFLVVMVVTQRLGFWAWVWPALYALHAVAILAGAPHFRGQWFALDVLVPIFGYGLASMIIGHFYSRYALHRLKALARVGGGDDDTGERETSRE
jgi:hypothetical protein